MLKAENAERVCFMLRRSTVRRIASLLLTATLCFLCIQTAGAEPEIAPVELTRAKSAAVAEASTMTLILSKEADVKRDVAGLARLPALLYVCETIDAGAFARDATVTVSEAAAAVRGPTAFVEPYERISAEALLKAAVMILAGDAIHALAEACAGTSGAALAAINARLAALSIEAECLSLSGEGTRLSANDLLKLGAALAKSETFCAYSAAYMDEILHEKGNRTELVNPNRLIRNTTGCFGMATGSSQEAGYCGLFGVRRGDTVYLCAVTGAPDSAARFAMAQEMVEYCFTAYQATALARAGEVLVEAVPVRGGTLDVIDLVAGSDAVLLLRQREGCERKFSLPDVLTAPLPADQAVGKAYFTGPDGNIAAEVELFPKTEVPAATLWEHVRRIFSSWLHA